MVDPSWPEGCCVQSADVIAVYDEFAADYDNSFEVRSLRRVYDELAWSYVRDLLPADPTTIVDVGCGTGRWVARCQARGHRLIGIEPAPMMRDVLRQKFDKASLAIIAEGVESASLPDRVAGMVIAMGSLQYTADPAAAVRKMVGWLQPGGRLCVHVDGLAALTMELLKLGKTEEALTRLEKGWGVFRYGSRETGVHLFDASRLAALLTQSGLINVETRGLLVSTSVWDRATCEAKLTQNESDFMALEQRLSRSPTMADAGKHILAWAQRPAD